MKKNLECKVTVKNGVRYYVDVSSNTCIDIICDDENAEEVCFDEGFDKVEIKLKSAGQLDNIKRIYIGESIKLINIPNKVFPNVREVKSDNERCQQFQKTLAVHLFTLETCRHRDVLMSILTIRTEFLILFCRTALLL